MDQNKYKNIILIGSTSEIGIAIINELKINEIETLNLVGRKNPDPSIFNIKIKKINFIRVDFEDEIEISKSFESIDEIKELDFAIVAAGYLPPENSELNQAELSKTFQINSISTIKYISYLTKYFLKQNNGDILFISSVAGLRPRVRNFTYGASKSVLDFYTKGLRNKYANSGVNFFIVRPGFVFTKMSKNFKPAPFAIDKRLVAEIVINGLNKKVLNIYAPRKLKYVFLILKLIPNKLFNKLG